LSSESTSIPVNPRTNRPVGYAFVDLKTAEEANKAIENLSGKDILDRKVSVQFARKPEEGEKKEATDAQGERKRSAGRGRGGRTRGRGGRSAATRETKEVGSQSLILENFLTNYRRTLLLYNKSMLSLSHFP
jgi:RNA recognition motif-containing protein